MLVEHLSQLGGTALNTLTAQLRDITVDMRAAYLAANLLPTAPNHPPLTVLPQSGNLIFRAGHDSLASYLHLYGKAYRLPLTAYDCDTSRISQPATSAPPTAPAARPRSRPARPPAPPDLLPLYPGRGVPATVAMASRTPSSRRPPQRRHAMPVC